MTSHVLYKHLFIVREDENAFLFALPPVLQFSTKQNNQMDRHLLQFKQMSFPIYLDWDRLSTLLNQNLGSKDTLSQLQETKQSLSSSKSIPSVVNTLIVTEQRTFRLIQESGIFLSLAKILKSNPRCAVKAAQVLSEIAKNGRLYFSTYNITTGHIIACQLCFSMS